MEVFWDIMQNIRAQFGENVRFLDLRIGEDGNYNTVTGAGEMHIVISEE